LSFAVRLWLFTKPDLENGNLSLQDAVRKPLSKICSTSSNEWIWLDFSANTLTLRAGFRIMWTSDLSEHLTFASKSVIRVFSYASVLEQFRRPHSECKTKTTFRKKDNQPGSKQTDACRRLHRAERAHRNLTLDAECHGAARQKVATVLWRHFFHLARSYRMKGMPRASLNCRGLQGKHCRKDCGGAAALSRR
jgi:hypothetical protein